MPWVWPSCPRIHRLTNRVVSGFVESRAPLITISASCGMWYRWISIEREVNTRFHENSTVETRGDLHMTRIFQEVFEDEDNPKEFRRVQLKYPEPWPIFLERYLASKRVEGSNPFFYQCGKGKIWFFESHFSEHL